MGGAYIFTFLNPSTLVERMVDQLGFNLLDKRKTNEVQEIINEEIREGEETKNKIEEDDEGDEDAEEHDENSLVSNQKHILINNIFSPPLPP